MAKKPLTCPWCDRKFSYSSKTHPMKRMSRHLWKDHREKMLRSIKKGKKNQKSKLRPIDKEFMAVDDITLALLKEISQGRDVEHDILGGQLLKTAGRKVGGKALGTVAGPFGVLIEQAVGQAINVGRGRVPNSPVAYVVLGKFLYDLFGMGYKEKGT